MSLVLSEQDRTATKVTLQTTMTSNSTLTRSSYHLERDYTAISSRQTRDTDHYDIHDDLAAGIMVDTHWIDDDGKQLSTMIKILVLMLEHWIWPS